MVTYRIDDGREGLWAPNVLIGVLSIIHSNQGQQVSSGTSPIYNELNLAYPSHTWFSSNTNRSFMRGYGKPWTLTNLVFVPRWATPRNTFQVTNYGNQILNLPQDTAYQRILRDFELTDNDLGAFYPFRLVATALHDINNGQTDWPADPYPISLDTFRSLLQNINNYSDWGLIQSSDWSQSSVHYNYHLYRRMRLILTLISTHLGLVNLGDDSSIVGINSEVVNQFLDISDITESQTAQGSTLTNTSPGVITPNTPNLGGEIETINTPAPALHNLGVNSTNSNNMQNYTNLPPIPGELYLAIRTSTNMNTGEVRLLPFIKIGQATEQHLSQGRENEARSNTDHPILDKDGDRLDHLVVAILSGPNIRELEGINGLRGFICVEGNFTMFQEGSTRQRENVELFQAESSNDQQRVQILETALYLMRDFLTFVQENHPGDTLTSFRIVRPNTLSELGIEWSNQSEIDLEWCHVN